MSEKKPFMNPVRNYSTDEELKWSPEPNNLNVASYYGGEYSNTKRTVKADLLMEYYLWNHLVFYKSFYKTGMRSATRPFLVMTLVFIFAAVISGGIFLRSNENNPVPLTISENTPIFEHMEYYHEHYYQGIAQTIYVPIIVNQNILSKENLLRQFDIHDVLVGTKVEIDGVEYGYNEVCLKEAISNQPVFYNILAFWDYSREVLESQTDEEIQTTLGSSKRYPFGSDINLSFVASDVLKEGESVQSISGFKAIYLLKHSGEENWSKVVLRWNQKVTENIAALEYEQFDVLSFTSSSREFENYDELDADWGIIIVSWILYILLGAMTLFSKDLVESRTMLIFAALVHSLMGYSAAVGFSGYMGTVDVPANRFCILITFIFTLCHISMMIRNYKRSDPNETLEERIAIAEQHTGMQLFTIVLCVFVSYMAASLYPLEGVHSFSLRLGLSLLMEQQFCLTWFCACLGLDAKRSQSGKLDILPCLQKVPNPHPRELTRKQIFMEQTFLSNLYLKFFSKTLMKLVVILITGGLLAVGIIGMKNEVETNRFDLEKLYPQDSQGQLFLKADQANFGTNPSSFYVILRDVDYDQQEDILKLIDSLKTSQYVLQGSIKAWYEEFAEFRGGQDFVTELNLFLQSNQGRKYSVDIIRDELGQVITSRINGMLDYSQVGSRFIDLEKQIDAKEHLENLVEQFGLDAYAYNEDWPTYESFPKSLNNIYQVVAVSIATLFGMEIIFLPPSVVIGIVFVAALTAVDMMGLMHFFNIGITPDTATFILLSWGIQTELSINFLYDFMSIPDSDKSFRSERALSLGSTSILPAMIIALVGTIPLLFASSLLTVTFAYAVFISVILSMWHAWFFLPVLYSWIGGVSINSYSFERLPCV